MKMRNEDTSKADLNVVDKLSSFTENIEKENFIQELKNITVLKDLSLELRKREANEPLYLTRYE